MKMEPDQKHFLHVGKESLLCWKFPFLLFSLTCEELRSQENKNITLSERIIFKLSELIM